MSHFKYAGLQWAYSRNVTSPADSLKTLPSPSVTHTEKRETSQTTLLFEVDEISECAGQSCFSLPSFLFKISVCFLPVHHLPGTPSPLNQSSPASRPSLTVFSQLYYIFSPTSLTFTLHHFSLTCQGSRICHPFDTLSA